VVAKQRRYKEIVDVLRRDGKASIRKLSELLEASEMTVRRDLDVLQQNGVVSRYHGGATLCQDCAVTENYRYLFDSEMSQNTLLKQAVGEKAASLIGDGETIAFDIGTTTPFVARNVSPAVSITAICHTYECLHELYSNKRVNIMLPGGQLNRETNVFYSQDGNAYLKRLRSDKAFVSPGGIDMRLGLTCYNGADAEIKRILMHSTKEVILVADSTKMGEVWPTHFADFTDFKKIVIDWGIREEDRSRFADLGIEVIIAEPRPPGGALQQPSHK